MSASPRLGARVRRRLTILLALTGGLLVPLGVGAPAASAEPAYDVEPPEVELAPGGRLVCASGSWEGAGVEFKYTWLRDGSAFATGAVYVLTNADKGHTFTCIVQGHNSEGAEEEESWNAYEYGGGTASRPIATSPPPEVSGTAEVGKTLECKHGGWSGTPAPKFEYEWLREGLPIESATASTYTVREEDEGYSLACSVTATNTTGSASKQSGNSVKVAGSAPSNVTLPEVLGNGAVGQTLTCAPEHWKGAPPPTFTYQWLRSGTKEPVGTGTTYTIVEADQLHTLSCRVTAKNSYGEASAESAKKVEVPGSPPTNTELPIILGTGEVGKELTCEPGAWSGVPKPTFQYQWLRDNERISFATTRSYTVVPADAGRLIACEVTAKNELNGTPKEAVAVSKPLSINGEAHGESIPVNTAAPTVSGEPSLGKTLTCSTGTWYADPPIEGRYSYQWLREKSPIGGATKNTYTVQAEDRGKKLSCRVTAKNTLGTGASESEPPVQVKGVRPEPNPEVPPSIAGARVVGETLTCSPGSWDGIPKPTFSYRWLGVTGPTSGNSYVILKSDKGHQLVCEVTATNFEGTASARSAAVEIPAVAPRIVGPSVSGASPPGPGTTMTCNSEWSGEPEPTISYVWLTDGGPIEGARSSTYVVTKYDEGHLLACEVIATNPAGTERAVSARVHIPGSPPEDVEAPSVAGEPQVGEQLTCDPGLWRGKPSPTLKYQWLINGVEVPNAAEETYVPEAESLGSDISCVVTASNTEGTAEESSSNSPQIVPHAVRKLEVLPVPPFTKTAAPRQPTTAQILASLEKQLSAALKKARRSGLLKHGSYSFAFQAPTGGKLEVLWYEPPKASKASSKAKPLLLAQVRSTFGGVSTRTQKLRLTVAGRRVLQQSKRPKLQVKGVFIPVRGTPVSWSKTIVLSG